MIGEETGMATGNIESRGGEIVIYQSEGGQTGPFN
jgi:hypothetical protein